MCSRWLVHAPAKINLHLTVGSLRHDGFHDIVSLVHFVGLYDTVRVSIVAPGIGVHVSGNPAVPEREDLAYRAAEAFLGSAGVAAAVEIEITKRIPPGGGLGGGSSDAAATLLALSEAFPGIVEPSELRRIAATLGSDVPLFLDGPAAVVTGRGEEVRPCGGLSSAYAVVVDTGVRVATETAYRWIDELRRSGRVADDVRHLLGDVCRDDPCLDRE